MSSRYQSVSDELQTAPAEWLVTGVAGFIGSHLLERLLRLGQSVVGLDNFSTGYVKNLTAVRAAVAPEAWARFRLIEGDIRDLSDCEQAVNGCDYVLHHAGLGSAPQSLADPITANAVNVGGFLNMLTAARDAGVKSFVYAASSSAYGDNPALPKTEDAVGAPMSPYAVTKYANELYATVYATTYGFKSIGLRYFNIFGPRQDPLGPYAAVIPLWALAMIRGDPVWINGDGSTTRDFTFVDNVVQANILAACADDDAKNEVFNVAFGQGLTLMTVFDALAEAVSGALDTPLAIPSFRDLRPGDVAHSQADISKASRLLGYAPTHGFAAGVALTVPDYLAMAKT